MNAFIRAVEQAKHIAVTGHIRPDGDCVGACLGVYNYIQDNYEHIQYHHPLLYTKYHNYNNNDKILYLVRTF